MNSFYTPSQYIYIYIYIYIELFQNNTKSIWSKSETFEKIVSKLRKMSLLENAMACAKYLRAESSSEKTNPILQHRLLYLKLNSWYV